MPSASVVVLRIESFFEALVRIILRIRLTHLVVVVLSWDLGVVVV